MTAQIIAHPSLLAQKRRKVADKKQRSEQKFLRCTTRHLKYLIEVMGLMLDLPKDHPLGVPARGERRAMGERLHMYRDELARRDARDNAPLNADRLSQRVNNLQSKFRKVS